MRPRIVKLAALAAFAALTVFACVARADAANCNISTSPVNFPNYSPLSSTATTSSGSVTVSCLIALTATITLGTGGSGTFTARTLLNAAGPATLSYNLYIDSGYSMVWGDGTAGTSTGTMILSLLHLSSSLPIYGRIPAGQDALVGTFNDTIVATVNF